MIEFVSSEFRKLTFFTDRNCSTCLPWTVVDILWICYLNKNELETSPAIGRCGVINISKVIDKWIEIEISNMTFAHSVASVACLFFIYGLLLKRVKMSYCITGTPWAWMRSDITDRKQSVKVGLSKSTSVHLICGVPQGFILGPLLFCTSHQGRYYHHQTSWIAQPLLPWRHADVLLL